VLIVRADADASVAMAMFNLPEFFVFDFFANDS